jgi:hypothetical protein
MYMGMRFALKFTYFITFEGRPIVIHDNDFDTPIPDITDVSA